MYLEIAKEYVGLIDCSSEEKKDEKDLCRIGNYVHAEINVQIHNTTSFT